MCFGIFLVGIVVYEWFMGIVVIVGDYIFFIEEVFYCWVECFGEGVFGIVLIDIFGIFEFFKVFSKFVRYFGELVFQYMDCKFSVVDFFILVVILVIKLVKIEKIYVDVFIGV